MKCSIWLIRHGSTSLNNSTDMSADRIRAWKDIPLSDEGEQEAHETAAALKGSGIKQIVSSDLLRAKQTAGTVGRALRAPVEYTKNLRPWDLGVFTGMTTKEAIPQIKKYICDEPNKRVSQGESFNSFKVRAFSGICDAVCETGGEGLAIVTHHRVERLLKAWVAAGCPLDLTVDLKVMTMISQDRIVEIGSALYGSSWTKDMSEDLGISKRKLYSWMTKPDKQPSNLRHALLEIAIDKNMKIGLLISDYLLPPT